MEISSFILWLAWAAFGTTVALVTYRLVRVAVTTPATAGCPLGPPVQEPEQPWLYCEEGAPLDMEARWFRVRPGERTVLGGKPRSATGDTSYVFLNAHDIAEDHALIVYDAQEGRYHLRATDGATVLHNNEPLTAGADAALTDGDTIDLGQMTRFRYTLAGPDEEARA